MRHYGSIGRTDSRSYLPLPDPQRGDGRGIDVGAHYEEIRRYLRVRFRGEVTALDLDAQELEDRVVLGLLRANRGTHPYDPQRVNGAGQQTSLQGYVYLKARTAISHLLRERTQARAVVAMQSLSDPDVADRLEEMAAPAEPLMGREARELLDELARQAREEASRRAAAACPLFPGRALESDPALREIEAARILAELHRVQPPPPSPAPHQAQIPRGRGRPKKSENEVSSGGGGSASTHASPPTPSSSTPSSSTPGTPPPWISEAVVVIRRPRRAA